MSGNRKKKDVTKMTRAELAEATAEFDAECVADTFHAPTAEARRRWERVKRKRGRPRERAGCKVISVSIEKRLLAEADAAAKKMGISRARLIERGLRTGLGEREGW